MTKLGKVAAIVLVGAVAVMVTAYATGLTPADWRHLGKPRNVLVVEGQQVRIPLPEGPQTRLRPEVPVTTTGSYDFMFDDAVQGPDRYDPCRTVDWTLNPAGMPDGADALIHHAVGYVADAAGLEFAYVGDTDEPATFDRELFQDTDGGKFAPVIVGWSNANDTTELAGSVTGLGGSSSVNGAFGDQRYLAGGVVILDADDVTELMRSQEGTELATAVIMHEFAHVIGLAHVDDDSELMNDENGELTTWGPGDLAGLAIAGAGPCQ